MSSDWHNRSGGNRGDRDRPRREPRAGNEGSSRGSRPESPGGFSHRGPGDRRGGFERSGQDRREGFRRDQTRERGGFREEDGRPRREEERGEEWRPSTLPTHDQDEQRQLGPRSWAFAERDEWRRREHAPDTAHDTFGRGPRSGGDGRGGFRREGDRTGDRSWDRRREDRREDQGRFREERRFDERPRAPVAGERRPSFSERPERPPFERRERPPYEQRRGRPPFEQRHFAEDQDRPLFQEGRPLGTVTRQGRSPVSAFERVQADVYGRWPVLEALRAGNITKLYLAAGINDSADHLREVMTLARERDIPVVRVERLALDRAVDGANHQGIAAAARPFAYTALEDLIEQVRRSTEVPLLVLFDGVQDPQNLGSVLRTADAAGVQGAVLPQHHQAGVTPAVIRASAGAAEHLPVAQVTNLRQSIDALKEEGYWIVGLDMEGGTDYDNLEVDSPIALVVGGEGRGLGRLVTDQCDYLVRLPMRGHVSSLNVSVATGIVLYEIQRRREAALRQPTGQARAPQAAGAPEEETLPFVTVLESDVTKGDAGAEANVEGIEDPGDIEGSQDYDAFADVLEAQALGRATDVADPEDLAATEDADVERVEDEDELENAETAEEELEDVEDTTDLERLDEEETGR